MGLIYYLYTIKLNNNTMTTAVNFNNESTKLVTVNEFEAIMNSIGMNWYGFKNISVNDRELFEEKTNISFEPTNDGKVRLHDMNFVWED